MNFVTERYLKEKPTTHSRVLSLYCSEFDRIVRACVLTCPQFSDYLSRDLKIMSGIRVGIQCH
jgi:hypothetical protein